MRCARAFELLSRRLDGELSYKEREGLREHLASCVACRELQARVEGDSMNLKRVLHFRRPDLRRFARRTMAFILEMEEPHRPADARARSGAASSPWFWIQTAGLAASVAVLAFFFLVRDPQLTREIARLEQALDTPRRVRMTRLPPPAGGPRSLEQVPPIEEASPPAEEPDATASRLESEAASEESGQAMEGVDPAVAAAADAGTVVENLILALQDGDRDAFRKWRDELLRIHDQSTFVFHQLVEFYDEEASPEKRQEILGVLSQFSTEGSQEFYLDRLSEESLVPLRRSLVRGIYETVAEGGQSAIPAVIAELSRVLRDPAEDWEVRFQAGRTLIGEMVVYEREDILLEVRSVILESPDARLRGELLHSLAQADADPSGFESRVSSLLAEVLNMEPDYDIRERMISGLLDRENKEEAVRVLDQISEKVDDRRVNLKGRLRLARDALRSDVLLGGSDLERR